jgi:hypothetical protein
VTTPRADLGWTMMSFIRIPLIPPRRCSGAIKSDRREGEAGGEREASTKCEPPTALALPFSQVWKLGEGSATARLPVFGQ